MCLREGKPKNFKMNPHLQISAQRLLSYCNSNTLQTVSHWGNILFLCHVTYDQRPCACFSRVHGGLTVVKLYQTTMPPSLSDLRLNWPMRVQCATCVMSQA